MKSFYLIITSIALLSCGVVEAADAELQFDAISQHERSHLIERAKLAASAYPGYAIPEGWRVLTQDEISRINFDSYGLAGLRGEDLMEFKSGLRFRLLHRIHADGLCLSFSGCDFDGFKWKSVLGLWDIDDVCKMFVGKIDEQYEQAAKLCEVIMNAYPYCNLDIVGHSLGGSLTIYAVAKCGCLSDNVRGYTFNAIGISRKMRSQIGTYQMDTCNRHVINVKDVVDPISNHISVGKLTIPLGDLACRCGLVYVLNTQSLKSEISKERTSWDRHGIKHLIETMSNGKNR